MNQYIRNNEILKGFLKKPLTLGISILFFIAAIVPNIYLVVKMISSGIFDSTALCVYSLLAVLPAVAFLNLFINGRNSKSNKRLNTPLILIYMYTVLSVFLPVAFFTYWMFSYAIEKNEFAFILSTIFVAAFLIPVLILLGLQFVSMLVTFHSIRKSANGIYLSRKGSVLMGVTSFVIAAAVILITMYFIDTTSYSRILNYSNMFDSVMLTLESAVLLALFVCLGIWSLMYSGAIKKAAVHLYGTKKTTVKAQTLADTQAAQQRIFTNDKAQKTNDFVPQKPFDTDINLIAEPTAYEKPDVFALPLQDEPNPYKSGNPVQKNNQQEETPDHINFQNPYENFVPQNPFNDF